MAPATSSILIILVQIWIILLWRIPLYDTEILANFTGNNDDVLTFTGIMYYGSTFYVEINHTDSYLCKFNSNYQFGFILRGNAVNIYGVAPDATNCINLQFIRGNRDTDTNLISVTFNVIKMLRGITFSIKTHNQVKVYFIRPIKKSGSVSKQNAGISNEDGKYRITWIPPATPNGMVSHYIVLMKLDASCMVQLDVLCSNCKGQKVGNAGTSIVSNQQCSIKQTRQFNKDDNIIMVDINNYVKQDTNYTIIIQPGNGWGWGEEVTFQFTSTKINIPPKLPDYIKIEIQYPPMNINIDKTSQLYVKLPLSAFKENANIITKFTVVVATVCGNITTESKLKTPNSFHDQTYMQCENIRMNSKDVCVYEVSISNEINSMALRRRKRVSTELQDKAFLLGAIKECKDESKYLCNGALQPETNYQISLRAYTVGGFITLTPTYFSTDKASSIIFPILFGVTLFILVIIIILFVLYIKRPEIFKKLTVIGERMRNINPDANDNSNEEQINGDNPEANMNNNNNNNNNNNEEYISMASSDHYETPMTMRDINIDTNNNNTEFENANEEIGDNEYDHPTNCL